jgi:3-deoxy-D-manno-octulosonic-acid transferase
MLFPYFLDALYALALCAFAPLVLWQYLRKGKARRGIWQRICGPFRFKNTSMPQGAVWFHGVSVGEVHLLRTIVAEFKSRHPQLPIVVSATTDTGLAEAEKFFGKDLVFRCPFDFSWAVANAMDSLRPNMIVLAESELWPNFLTAAKARRIPVVVVNARVSPRSFARLRRVRSLVASWMRTITCVAAQTGEYAHQYSKLGVPSERIRVTGSAKYDGVQSDRNNENTQTLRQQLNIQETDIVWVAGSTSAPEEEIILRVYQKLEKENSRLRLIIVPRQSDRFEEVAEILVLSGESFVRRSRLPAIVPASSIILIDTIGELRAAWGLATVAFVGGSMDGQRGGQNMIEPAAYGAAVIFGVHTWNFRETVSRLIEAKAAIQVRSEAELEATLRQLLQSPEVRETMGMAASHLVRTQQGATARTVDILGDVLEREAASRDSIGFLKQAAHHG